MAGKRQNPEGIVLKLRQVEVFARTGPVSCRGRAADMLSVRFSLSSNASSTEEFAKATCKRCSHPTFQLNL